MMTGLLNIGSLLLGLIAWAIPMLVCINKNLQKHAHIFAIISFTCCSLAPVLQIYEIRHRVDLNDFSAVMDTIGAISWVSLVLVLVTVILNILVLKANE